MFPAGLMRSVWSAQGESPPGLPPVSPETLQQYGKHAVADWMRCPRFYTKDNRRDTSQIDIRRPGDIGRLVHRIADHGGTVLRQAVYWGGDAYYQSQVATHAPGLRGLDYLREAMDAARERGVKVFAYMNPRLLETDTPLYPEFAVRDFTGAPWDIHRTYKTWRFSCTTHPGYRKFLCDVLTEIFGRYGADGLYVDGLTCNVCFCEHCRSSYRRRFGEEMPAKFQSYGPAPNGFWELTSYPIRVGDPRDPDSERLTEHLWENEKEVTVLFHQTVKRANPEALVFYHNMPKPDTVHLYDAALSEVYIKRPWTHTLWKHGELSNYSAVFPVPSIQNIGYQGMTDAEITHNMLQSLANASYPNVFFHKILEDSFGPMKAVFDYLRANARYLDFARTVPHRFLAFVRTTHCDPVQKTIAAEQGTLSFTDRFLKSYVGMYSALLRQRLPIVTRQQPFFHQHLDGFRVLCLANEASLSSHQAERIRQFVKAGGGLIATQETSLYDDRADKRNDFALADVFGVRYERSVDIAREGRLTFERSHPVTASLAGNTIRYENQPHPVVRVTTGRAVAFLEAPGLSAGAIPAAVVSAYGKGRAVYIPARLDAMQCDTLLAAVESLMGNAVRWASRDRLPVQVDHDDAIGVTLFDQPGGRVLHLMNYSGETKNSFTQVEPLCDIPIAVRLPPAKRVKSVRRLWRMQDLPYEIHAGMVRFCLDSLEEYEAVAIAYS